MLGKPSTTVTEAGKPSLCDSGGERKGLPDAEESCSKIQENQKNRLLGLLLYMVGAEPGRCCPVLMPEGSHTISKMPN